MKKVWDGLKYTHQHLTGDIVEDTKRGLMIYDKVSAKVGYNDSAHTYTNIISGEKYESVTTLIKRFTPEFKGEYWATYKAIKDVLENVGLWYNYKREAGGWENVVDYYLKNGYLSIAEDIAFRKQVYLDAWAEEGRVANIKGSIIHEDLEKAAYHAHYIKEGEINYEVTQEDILDIQDFTSNRIYPELLIHNDEYMVAGQADKVFKQGLQVDVHDYKTYKKLEYEGFRGETLLAPLAHIQNGNYWKTAIQLSIYGWMLEELGYEVRTLYMHWIRGKDKDDKERNHAVETYELPYLKDEVITLMLNK